MPEEPKHDDSYRKPEETAPPHYSESKYVPYGKIQGTPRSTTFDSAEVIAAPLLVRRVYLRCAWPVNSAERFAVSLYLKRLQRGFLLGLT